MEKKSKGQALRELRKGINNEQRRRKQKEGKHGSCEKKKRKGIRKAHEGKGLDKSRRRQTGRKNMEGKDK